MKKLQIIALLVAMAILVSLCAACGGGDKPADTGSTGTDNSGSADSAGNADSADSSDDTTPPDAPADDVTISVATWWGGGNFEIWEANGAEFTKMTGVDVELELIGWYDYGITITTGFLSGTAPDVIQTEAGNWFVPFLGAGVLEPLDDWISSKNYDVDRLFPGFLDAQKGNDGVIYALPHHWSQFAMCLNLDLFDEAGVPYPPNKGWTWDEFFEVLPLLTRDTTGDGRNDVFATYIHEMLPADIVRNQHGIPYQDASGKVIWDTPEMLEIVTQFAEANEKYGPGLTEINPFVAGETAMSFDWDGAFFDTAENYNFNARIVDMPQVAGTTRYVFFVTNAVSMNTASTHKEEAWMFMDYFTSAQGELDRSFNGSVVPCGAGPAWDQWSEPRSEFPFDAVQQIATQPGDRVREPAPLYEWFTKTISAGGELPTEWAAVTSGAYTPKQFVERMQLLADDAME